MGLALVSPYGKMGARRDVMGVVQGSHQKGEEHEYILEHGTDLLLIAYHLHAINVPAQYSVLLTKTTTYD
ncbi:hypothetical protein [Pseudomonas amygdali]|uniref:Uncharacterized protein n=1 Tax=Pseudomonas amygdali pv. lachrymans str. M301315 TaxID=629260 RepID=A0AAD0M7F2_PSEAV|nr:hypothetical protein [Pseudomonas amygdali]AXH59543.1 hypothetical protein PLA107_030415 [Pseudomonas amygdali pv. lachrymans str. M301315]